jgi:hypothetical protein
MAADRRVWASIGEYRDPGVLSLIFIRATASFTFRDRTKPLAQAAAASRCRIRLSVVLGVPKTIKLRNRTRVAAPLRLLTLQVGWQAR